MHTITLTLSDEALAALRQLLSTRVVHCDSEAERARPDTERMARWMHRAHLAADIHAQLPQR